MAIPTLTGAFVWNGVERNIHQYISYGATTGIMEIAPTVSATDDFMVLSLNYNIYDTGGTSCTISINNQVLWGYDATNLRNFHIDIPNGLRVSSANTSTAHVNFQGGSSAGWFAITGFFV